jgi:hypothetical protein
MFNWRQKQGERQWQSPARGTKRNKTTKQEEWGNKRGQAQEVRGNRDFNWHKHNIGQEHEQEKDKNKSRAKHQKCHKCNQFTSEGKTCHLRTIARRRRTRVAHLDESCILSWLLSSSPCFSPLALRPSHKETKLENQLQSSANYSSISLLGLYLKFLFYDVTCFQNTIKQRRTTLSAFYLHSQAGPPPGTSSSFSRQQPQRPTNASLLLPSFVCVASLRGGSGRIRKRL